MFTDAGKQIQPKSNSEGSIAKGSFTTQTQEDSKATVDGCKPNSNLKPVLKSIPHKEGEGVEEFEAEWSSDSEEDFVLSGQKSAQRDDMNLKLAQNFMFENSGLTQQQILAVIQYQNAAEGELQQNSECFLSPDQPSTSGSRNRERALLDHSDACTFSGMQDKASESSYSQTGAGNISEIISNRNGGDSVSEVNCSRSDVSLTEASCSGHGVRNTCDAGVLDKWKVNVLNDQTIDKNNSTEIQEVNITESNNDSVSVLSPVEHKQKDGNNETEQMNSDSDSDTGFIEVTDVVTQPAYSHTSEKNSLELIIQQDKECEIENDIFADVFCAQASERLLTKNNNLPEHTVINLSSNDNNITAGLEGTKDGKFDKEGIRNGINDGTEGSKSTLKMEGKELMECIETQYDRRWKDLKVEKYVGTSCDVESEEDSKQVSTALSSVKPEDSKQQVTITTLSSVEPEEDSKQQVIRTALFSAKSEEGSKQQVTRTTLSSEELQKLQVLVLCCYVCLCFTLFCYNFLNCRNSIASKIRVLYILMFMYLGNR